MQAQIQAWLESHDIMYADLIAVVIALFGILVTGFLIYQVARLLTRRIMQPILAKSSFLFIRNFFDW